MSPATWKCHNVNIKTSFNKYVFNIGNFSKRFTKNVLIRNKNSAEENPKQNNEERILDKGHFNYFHSRLKKHYTTKTVQKPLKIKENAEKEKELNLNLGELTCKLNLAG